MESSDYKALFISESNDIVMALENGIMNLEGSSDPSSCVDELFRQAHNLKGMSGAMGYDSIVEVSHSLENVLSRCREGALELTSSETDLLLKVVDRLRELIDWEIGESGGEQGTELLGEILVLLSPLSMRLDKDRSNKECVEEKKPEEAAGSKTGETTRVHAEVTSTRVDLERLDYLMDLVGELVISRIRLSSLAGELECKNLSDELVSSGRLISEIQKEIMEARLVPVGLVFQRFKRVVRDIARELEKDIDFEITGTDIGLDRTVLESMVDPLVHLIRNAIDHGIEGADERSELGKPESGTIALSARRERNHVVLEIYDDGRGIDREKIVKKNNAARKGMGGADDLSEDELFNLLTSPGFSTKDAVSRFSGRGVGLDVVRKTIDSLGGSMRIESESGSGTTISMSIPVNLSIIKALLFSIGDGVHALPIEYVKETMRMERGAFRRIGGREVVQTQEGPVPVVNPAEIFDWSVTDESARYIKIIKVEMEDGTVCFVVSRILGQQDVVIKGLPSLVRGTGGISGATILGSGKIAFIWDPRVFFNERSTHESDRETVVLEG